MIRLFFLTFILLIGLSMIIAKNDFKFHKIHQKRFSRNNEQIRNSRNLVGKLIDTETNIIYTVDGQKQQDTLTNSGATTIPTLTSTSLLNHEEIACLAACHSCVEEYSIGSRKKKAADNCGPMCDCADSCFFMSIEQVGKIYGKSSNIHSDKNCWWRTYTEILNS